MDVRYINPFLAAIQELFETMINLPVTMGKPEIKKGENPAFEVSGIIGISGEVAGSVVVSFPNQIAIELASALLDQKLDAVNEDCTDAIGEIANIVAGSAKKRFPETNTTVSVPTVAIGKYSLAYPSGVPIIRIPCETKSGRFVLDVALKVVKN